MMNERQRELDRLHALHNLKILDTPNDSYLDSLTKKVADYFEVPIVLISLVDANRQWFKSRYGLQDTSTDRDISFCTHAIKGDGVFVIPDALDDGRFMRNPLVVGHPHIRLYAGAPLTVDGRNNIGTLCLVDTMPRTLTEEETRELRFMAESVELYLKSNYLDYDRAASQYNEALLKKTLAIASDPIVVVDQEQHVIHSSHSAEQILDMEGRDVRKTYYPLLWKDLKERHPEADEVVESVQMNRSGFTVHRIRLQTNSLSK